MVAAIALGAGAAFGDTVDYEPENPRWLAGSLANLPFAWATLGFFAGAAVRHWPLSAIAGVAALALAVVAYYGTHSAFDLRQGVDDSSLVDAGEVWLAAAIPAGLVFGVAGNGWRRGGPSLRAAAAGILLSSSFALVPLAGWNTPVATLVGCSVVLAVVLVRRPFALLAALVIGAGLALFAAIAVEILAEAARGP